MAEVAAPVEIDSTTPKVAEKETASDKTSKDPKEDSHVEESENGADAKVGNGDEANGKHEDKPAENGETRGEAEPVKEDESESTENNEEQPDLKRKGDKPEATKDEEPTKKPRTEDEKNAEELTA